MAVHAQYRPTVPLNITITNNDLNQVESAILHKSRGLSHQNSGERIECSNLFLFTIIRVFSLVNILKSISNDFDG